MKPGMRTIRAIEALLEAGEQTTEKIASLPIYAAHAKAEWKGEYTERAQAQWVASGRLDEELKDRAECMAGRDLKWLNDRGYLVQINPGMHVSVVRWRLIERYHESSPANPHPWNRSIRTTEWDPEWREATARFRETCDILEKSTGARVHQYGRLEQADDVGLVEIQIAVKWRVGRDILKKREPAEVAALILERTGASELMTRGAKLQHDAIELRANIFDDDRQIIPVDFAAKKRGDK